MTDWYVTNDGAGSEDGTFGNAWAIDGIVWGEGGVVAGDALHVDGILYGRIAAGASGEAGNPIRIRFNPGSMLWPSVDESSGWTKVGGFDVYYRTVTGGYRYELWADGNKVPPIGHDNSPDTRGTEAALMTENTWRMRGSTEIMFYAPGGVDPSTLSSVRATDRGLDDAYGAIDLRGQSHITVIDMNVKGARWNGGMPAAFVTEGDGITIIGGSIENCERICKVYGGARFGIIGLVADGLESTGISLLGATSAETPVSNPLSDVTIRHCRITNVGYAGRYRGLDWSITGDNDAIGIGYEGGNVTNVEISDNYFGNIGPQWAKDADVPAYFTSSDVNRGAGVYVGTSEVVAIDVAGLKILRNEMTGISRYCIHLGAECTGLSSIIGNLFRDTGRYIAFDATVLVRATENAGDHVAMVCQNKFVRALSRSSILFANANSRCERYTYSNCFDQCDKVEDATGESWYGDIWRYTSGTWAPAVDEDDYNFHGDRTGLSNANIARDSTDTSYTSIAAYRAGTTYANNSIQSSDPDDAIAAGGDWWTALGESVPLGNDGNRFMSPPSMGAYEVRTKSGYARTAGAMPARVLPAGVDMAKARIAA